MKIRETLLDMISFEEKEGYVECSGFYHNFYLDEEKVANNIITILENTYIKDEFNVTSFLNKNKAGKVWNNCNSDIDYLCFDIMFIIMMKIGVLEKDDEGIQAIYEAASSSNYATIDNIITTLLKNIEVAHFNEEQYEAISGLVYDCVYNKILDDNEGFRTYLEANAVSIQYILFDYYKEFNTEAINELIERIPLIVFLVTVYMISNDISLGILKNADYDSALEYMQKRFLEINQMDSEETNLFIESSIDFFNNGKMKFGK